MDPITLTTITIGIAAPFLIKSGEKFAESIGEDVWNWIKQKFSKKEVEEIDTDQKEGIEGRLSKVLLKKIESDSDFKKQLEALVNKAKNDLGEHSQQNITNISNVEKQINIQENKGNITM